MLKFHNVMEGKPSSRSSRSSSSGEQIDAIRKEVSLPSNSHSPPPLSPEKEKKSIIITSNSNNKVEKCNNNRLLLLKCPTIDEEKKEEESSRSCGINNNNKKKNNNDNTPKEEELNNNSKTNNNNQVSLWKNIEKLIDNADMDTCEKIQTQLKELTKKNKRKFVRLTGDDDEDVYDTLAKRSLSIRQEKTTTETTNKNNNDNATNDNNNNFERICSCCDNTFFTFPIIGSNGQEQQNNKIECDICKEETCFDCAQPCDMKNVCNHDWVCNECAHRCLTCGKHCCSPSCHVLFEGKCIDCCPAGNKKESISHS